ncbi:MAG: hypothetical protein HQL78_06675 [Magnetococcales bacterium]|nr:hypothetical protein [Magnetococcales bacterium]
MEYFSDQEHGKVEVVREDISDQVWCGILSYVNTLIATGAFGEAFPEICPDGQVVIGTNSVAFWEACRAEIPSFSTLKVDKSGTVVDKPETPELLDFIQFCYQNVSAPIKLSYHDYFKHHHLTFNGEKGRLEFVQKINKIFERNRIEFRLQYDGSIIRTLPPELNQLLNASKTGNEAVFDRLLNDAKTNICDPDPKVRKDGLERLWDAWERLKTLEEGNDKKAQTTKLLDKAATAPEFRKLLEEEAKVLTAIGNTFQIRHHEQGKHEIKDPGQIDYLFFRMLSMIFLLLKARSGPP